MRTSSSLTLPLALTLALALSLGGALWVRGWMLDDAFIFFRYAENWVAGAGPVFNAGEPPVEGYTSFLWLSLLAIGHALGGDLVSVSLILGYTCALATVLLCAAAPRFWPALPAAAGPCAAVLLASCGAFLPWAQSGMETSLHALLLCVLAVTHLVAIQAGRSLAWSLAEGLLMALLAMNRPDGLLAVAVLGLHRLGCARRLGWRGVVGLSSVFLLVFGSYYLWRYTYYGYPFPNTYYVKVGGGSAQVWRGLGYVAEAALVLLPLLLGLLLAVPRVWREGGLCLLALVLGYIAYIVSVGGDVMPAYRFFTPLLPLVCLLCARGLSSLPRPKLCLAATVLAMTWGLGAYFGWIVPVIRGDVVAQNGRVVGEWMRRELPAETRIAVNAAGALVYYSKLPALDMLGLNDLHIAHRDMPGMGSGIPGHEKGDGRYVLQQAPDLIQLGDPRGWHPDLPGKPPPPFPGDRELWADPRFKQSYRFLFRREPTVSPGGAPLGAFGVWVTAELFAQLGGNPR